MAVIHLNEKNFVDEVMGSPTSVLIDFYADWCGPCRALSPTVEKIAERTDVKVCKVNVDDSPQIANTFNVQVIPTLVAMKDGGVIGKTEGVRSEAEILALLGI